MGHARSAEAERDARAMKAVAGLYHAYFTGLILTLVTRRSAQDAAEWVFRVFRHQHHEKFLSSFDKLGLAAMPDAVACAASRPAPGSTQPTQRWRTPGASEAR